jgi:hypothetical protein
VDGDWAAAARRALACALEGRLDQADAADRLAARLAPPEAHRVWRDHAALWCRLAGRPDVAAWYQDRSRR